LSNSMRSLKINVGWSSHLACARVQQVKENIVARGEGGLKNIAYDIRQTACMVTVSPIMFTGLANDCSVKCVETSPPNDELGANDRYKVRIGD